MMLMMIRKKSAQFFSCHHWWLIQLHKYYFYEIINYKSYLSFSLRVSFYSPISHIIIHTTSTTKKKLEPFFIVNIYLVCDTMHNFSHYFHTYWSVQKSDMRESRRSRTNRVNDRNCVRELSWELYNKRKHNCKSNSAVFSFISHSEQQQQNDVQRQSWILCA